MEHHHHKEHDHHHGHHHGHSVNEKNKKLFIGAIILTLSFAVLEIVYGFISGSLMIIGDGIHMSSDAISLLLSLIAVFMAGKSATSHRTFGYKRFEPIAAFVNGLTLIVLPVYILVEACKRMIHPVEIQGKEMLLVGVIGMFVNIVVAFVLSKGESNINIRSAMLHVVADLITSVSAVIVALSIILFDIHWLDPIGSIITSIIIIRGGISITKEAFHILMESVPHQTSVNEIEHAIHHVKEVSAIKEIKIWGINEEEIYMLIRVTLTDSSDIENVTDSIKTSIHEHSHIPSSYIYIEATLRKGEVSHA
jgi:cobalt-zinc-cadmium efflux system protein